MRNTTSIFLCFLGAFVTMTPALQAASVSCSFENPPAGVDQVCDYTRDVSIFVGTLTPFGVPEAAQSFVWGSSDIAGSLGNAILNDPGTDARLTLSALNAFLSPLNSVDWVLDTAVALPNPLEVLGAMLDGTYGAGSLVVGSPVLLSGPASYLLLSDFAFFPCGTEQCLTLTNYNGRVTVFQQDATWTAGSATAVPEPGYVALMALAGTGLLLKLRFRAHAR